MTLLSGPSYQSTKNASKTAETANPQKPDISKLSNKTDFKLLLLSNIANIPDDPRNVMNYTDETTEGFPFCDDIEEMVTTADNESEKDKDSEIIFAMQNIPVFHQIDISQIENPIREKVYEIEFYTENRTTDKKFGSLFVPLESDITSEVFIDEKQENLLFSNETDGEIFFKPKAMPEAVKDITAEDSQTAFKIEPPKENISNKQQPAKTNFDKPVAPPRLSERMISETAKNPEEQTDNINRPKEIQDNKKEMHFSNFGSDSKKETSDPGKVSLAEKEKNKVVDIATSLNAYQGNATASKIESPTPNEPHTEQLPIMQVANKAVEMLGQNKTSFKMKLFPEGLGEITVDMTLNSGRLDLKIHTELEKTRAMLESQLHILQAELKTNDYIVQGVDIFGRAEGSFNFDGFQFNNSQYGKSRYFSNESKKDSTALQKNDNAAFVYSPISVYTRGKLNYTV